MAQPKAAVMIYPSFSLQEITCLTSALTVWYEREVDIFASSREIVKSEDGFQVTAGRTFDSFDASAYDCLILPGTTNPVPALRDERNIRFLRTLEGKGIVLAGISSAPLLLAEAGLLENRKFTGGLFEEMIDYLDFVPKGNVVHVPVCRDGNVITAIGFAFREFAVAVLRAVGIACDDDLFGSVSGTYTEEELTFRMGEESFREFLAQYRAT
jgi:4-methyl-5(b-hydroxyethyl)-thiazole monophosphate biosynthesis